MFYRFCLEGVGGFGVPELEAAKEAMVKNPSCAPAPLARPTNARLVEQTSAEREEAGKLVRHHGHPGAKQSSVQAMGEDCCYFWAGPFVISRGQLSGTFPPPFLDHTFTLPWQEASLRDFSGGCLC